MGRPSPSLDHPWIPRSPDELGLGHARAPFDVDGRPDRATQPLVLQAPLARTLRRRLSLLPMLPLSPTWCAFGDSGVRFSGLQFGVAGRPFGFLVCLVGRLRERRARLRQRAVVPRRALRWRRPWLSRPEPWPLRRLPWAAHGRRNRACWRESLHIAIGLLARFAPGLLHLRLQPRAEPRQPDPRRPGRSASAALKDTRLRPCSLAWSAWAAPLVCLLGQAGSACCSASIARSDCFLARLREEISHYEDPRQPEPRRRPVSFNFSTPSRARDAILGHLVCRGLPLIACRLETATGRCVRWRL